MSEGIAPELLARSRRKFSDVMGADLVKDGEEGETKAYPIVFMAPDGTPEPQWEPQAAAADLRRWKARAIKAVKMGKAAAVRFESDAIPPDEQARIRGALGVSQSAGDVVKAFGGGKDGSVQDEAITDRGGPLLAGAVPIGAAISGADRGDKDGDVLHPDVAGVAKAAADPADTLIDAEFGAALTWAKKAME